MFYQIQLQRYIHYLSLLGYFDASYVGMIKRDVQKSHEYNHNHHWFSAPQHGAEVLHRPGQGQLLDWPLPEAGAGEAPRATVLDQHLAVAIGQREEVGGRLLPAIQRRQRLNVVFYRKLRSRVAPGI